MITILDKYFYDDFFKYYGDFSSINVSNHINSDMEMFTAIYDNDYCENLITDGLNVAKTAGVIGTSYFKFCRQLDKKISFIFPREQDLNKFMFNIAFIYLYNNIPEQVSEFLGVRLSPRDIYVEVAEQLYGNNTDESVEKIKNITTKHTYSVNKNPPKSRDEWFFRLCLEVGSNSKCFSRKIGAVLVRDKSVISTGYNGPPRGIPTCDQRWNLDKEFSKKYGKDVVGHKADYILNKCPRYVIGFKSGEGLDICVAAHAEENALLNAARNGIQTKGTKIYMNCSIPCKNCLIKIINCGVEEIIITSVDFYDISSEYLLKQSNLKCRLFTHLKD